jgi:CheY-like chemotaxis protein
MAAYFVPKTENTWGRLKPLICQLLGLTAELPEITNGPDSGRSQIIEPLENSQGSESIDALFSALGWEPTVVDTTASDGPSPQSTPGPWVLTIDDDSDLSFSLKVRLAEHGVDVLRAFEGMEGFRYAFAGQAQAIILDYEMPDVNGDYVLRRLQENPVTRNIPVVVLTGHQDNALKRKMFNLGAAAFLTKPVRWEELWEELQKHITPPEIAMV